MLGGLQQGVFSLYSSDHCPFRYDDPQGKLNPKGRTSFRWVPNGIPGIETRLPILFSEGVERAASELNEFVAFTATNHAKTYGLYPKKGTIAVGSDADIAIWDPERKETISQKLLHHGSDYTPYEGIEVTGWPVSTMVRGKFVVRDGEARRRERSAATTCRAKNRRWPCRSGGRSRYKKGPGNTPGPSWNQTYSIMQRGLLLSVFCASREVPSRQARWRTAAERPGWASRRHRRAYSQDCIFAHADRPDVVGAGCSECAECK